MREPLPNNSPEGKREDYYITKNLSLSFLDEESRKLIRVRVSSPYLAIRVNNKEYFLTRHGRLEGVAHYEKGSFPKYQTLSQLLQQKNRTGKKLR